jgi:hypothetical protein
VSTAAFLGGTAGFLIVGVAAVATSWTVVRRRAPHLDALDRAVAVALVSVVVLLAVHLVPLAFGVLSRLTVVIAALLAVGVGFAVRARPGPGDPPRPPAPTDRPAGWLIASVTGLAVLVAAVAQARLWLPRSIVASDSLNFHLPNVARWIQTGSLWQIDDFLPLQSHGTYPNSGELLMTWAMLPFKSDFLVRPVMIGVLALWVLAIVATARELGASPAARTLAASVLPAIPVVGIATVPDALPDILAYFGLTAGLLFLLRYSRTQRVSDLVLAGLGIGVMAGTKWYGVPAALILVVVFAGSRRLAGTSLRAQARHLAALTGVIAATGGIWLVRNLVELGNPVFPTKVSVFGLTLFDAPRDVVGEKAGFSIANYANDPHVLFGQIPTQIRAGVGWLAVAAIPLAVICAVLARRRLSARTGALLVAALLLAVMYVFLPYSALGLRGHPVSASVNTRYLVPALIPLVLAAAWAAGRWRYGIVIHAALAAAALSSLSRAFGPLQARTLVAAALAILAAAAFFVGVVRVRPADLRRRALVAASVVIALAAVGYMRHLEQGLDHTRYTGTDPALTALDKAGGGVHVGLAGIWSPDGIQPVWPAFGRRIGNEVRFLGTVRRGFLTSPGSERGFRRLLRSQADDLLVVGRGQPPAGHVQEEDWARAAGLVAVTQSRRLVLYATPVLAKRLTSGGPVTTAARQ